MCGRYPTPPEAAMREQFQLGQLSGYRQQPNVAPTDAAPVVVASDKTRELRTMKWGLLPHWSKDATAGARMINARLETIFEKRAYANYIRRSRCIIPALGFFEWDREKNPYLIRLKGGQLMGFAGIWTRWHDPSGPDRVIETYSIITTDANPVVGNVHDRMPAVVPKAHYSEWLDRGLDEPKKIRSLVSVIAGDDVELILQDRAINNARNKEATLRLKQ